MKSLPAKYNHRDIEPKWQNIWHSSKIYNWEEELPREQTFVIDTPPPTVSGVLHMGHIFSYTQADFVARFQRMLGKTVFYPIGFDDNGLPTERLVEKVKKIRASSMPRDEFVKVCREVVVEAEDEFRKVFKSIALSVDWNQEYQTISDNSIKLAQMSFLDLIDKDRAYRKSQPTLWDPVDATALAQAEVVDIEMQSFMNEINFYTENGEKLVISTTRPELLPACVAVFYHPKDARYIHLLNQNAITPLFGVKVPLIADDKVDIEKGTGLVMCCTFGDTTDIDWWRQYDLPLRVILDRHGKIDHLNNIGSANWPSVTPEKAKIFSEQLQGLKAKAAREKMIELLKESGDFIIQHAVTHMVKCGERSSAPLEILVTSQWFIKLLDIKQELLAQSAKCNWNPEYMKIRLDHWIEGLKWDWCISRQRFFGVPFPVWYSKRAGEEGKALFAHPDDLPINPITSLPRGYREEEVEPDFDIMDTWATSSISPQLSSGAINAKYSIDYERHKKLFPADMRPQAHEIIRVWAFYTIVKSYLHESSIPWQNLMISGWCLAADKTKMSKSKGNVITPVDLIEEKGADIIRYWASNSKLGADIAYCEDVFKLGAKLINKLWNASKFTAMQLTKLQKTPSTIKADIESGLIFKPIDLWLLDKLKQTVEKATEQLKKFEYCNARVIIEDFFWNIYCDNYIEIVKTRSYDENGLDLKGQQSCLSAMYHCLKTLLKLFALYLPHVTEEIYSYLFEDSKLLNQRGSWPILDEFISNDNAEKLGDALLNILDLVRKIKAEKQISVSFPISKLHIENVKSNIDITQVLDDLANVTKAIDISRDGGVTSMQYTEDELFKISCIIE
jgi:valyl-tRNA synthetase